MEVEVQGHPEPIVKWYREGAEISSSPDYNLSRSNKLYRLTISEVFPEDAGRFKVIAANAEGSTATEATLQVEGEKYCSSCLITNIFLKRQCDLSSISIGIY